MSLGPAVLEALARGRQSDPADVLGPQRRADGSWVVRVLRPDARAVFVEQAGESSEARWLHGDGVLEAELPDGDAPYRLRVRTATGESLEEDPYRFPPSLAKADLADFAAGRDARAWEKLGAHCCEHEGVAGVRFAVWAPNAERVAVIGTFNDWNARRHGMRPLPATGVWELFVPEVEAGALYKFEIRTKHGGRKAIKADPFGRAMELRPDTASIVVDDREPFAWRDGTWVGERTARQWDGAPLSVYEVHLGSWLRPGGEDAPFATWDQLADRLLPYVKGLGFTHLELLPVTEHPFDGSWGYQTIGYFAPTSRFGDPDGFRRFVDRAHELELGVWLDWVPAHFPKDAHGLGYFDGTHLFEPEDPRRRDHPDWDTFIFDYGRPEVRSFLLSSAAYWVEEFHVDGLRVDAVASMLHLDYSRGPGQWKPNRHGGRENLEAVEFLRALNDTLREVDPGVLTVAEESTSWPGVTRASEDRGLGFRLKWNMGWMNDTLRFFRTDPSQRADVLRHLTFGLTYAFEERHLLPLSHDEVVHLKKSLLSKMPGDEAERFANLRTLYGMMWAHPGRKLLFMGGEFGQLTEWDHDAELPRNLADEPRHRGVQEWITALNGAYRAQPALHTRDDEWAGFEWVELGEQRCGLAFLRRTGDDLDVPVLVVANLSAKPWKKWRVGVPVAGTWRRLLHSEEESFGGAGDCGPESLAAEETASHDRPGSLVLDVPARSISWWRAPGVVKPD